ncbi:MAG: hypothetical protein MRJ68_13150 [Nitrospira sp.]|nr:hypothetical protein [Nitrospira sp.]
MLLQQQLLRDQLAEYHAKVAAAQHLVDQRRAVVGQTKENLRRLEATVPMELNELKPTNSCLIMGP